MKHYILLDRSGSMITDWEETLTALNAYVKEAKKNDKITLCVFDNFVSFKSEVTKAKNNLVCVETLRDNVKVSKFKDLSPNECKPRGMTPLYDAVMTITNMITEKKGKKVVLLIITDGFENASKEYTRDSARKALDNLRKKNFEVLFIGADFDNSKDAFDLGSNHTKTTSMSRGSYAQTMTNISGATRAYGSGKDLYVDISNISTNTTVKTNVAK